MKKPKFDYQTPDEALVAGGKNKVLLSNPEGFGPETARVMQEIYARRSEFGDQKADFSRFGYDAEDCELDFRWAADSRKYRDTPRHADSLVLSLGLEDGASLGDVYVYSAVKEAQFSLYRTLLARDFLKSKDLKKWCIDQAKDQNDVNAESHFRRVHIVRYAKHFKDWLDKTWGCKYDSSSSRVLGDKLDSIKEAVRKDLGGLTDEEMEQLRAKCEKIIRKSEGLVAKVLDWFERK